MKFVKECPLHTHKFLIPTKGTTTFAKPILLQNERKLVHTSKRGRLFKRKFMKEYIVEVQKKKKIGNHSKV
ncbi:hypothetical protein H5410_062623 [Solanum commersonii]|uniref:Uncharacterized protein n=1 Tax=Solanum commersonii TaxID=4109 RepID=A0A9J5WB61_SOLCO|nr:hypothetical protein H5410_062623 [Solanum commersonii]